jgi:hypothetical protein
VEQTIPRARCASCGRGLSFADWERGSEVCGACELRPANRLRQGPAAPPPAEAWDYRRHEEMLDEVPEELVAELVAALEDEAKRAEGGGARDDPGPVTAAALLRGVVDEVGLGRSEREGMWAAWGFTIGFGFNLALAKYAQVTGGGSFTDFVLPMLIGGLVAGAACGAVGWGLAKLRDRSPAARRG